MTSELELAVAIVSLAFWIVVVFQSLVLVGLVRAYADGRSTSQTATSEAAPVEGERAPEFVGVTVGRESIGTDAIRGRLTALLFVSPTCATCMTTLSELHALSHKALGNVILICRGTEDSCRLLGNRYEITYPMVVDTQDDIGRKFGMTATPSAVLIGEDYRIIQRGYPGRSADLESLLTAGDAKSVAETDQKPPLLVSEAMEHPSA